MCGNHGFANAQIGFIVLVVEYALCSHQKKTKHPQASPETPFNPSGALCENPLKILKWVMKLCSAAGDTDSWKTSCSSWSVPSSEQRSIRY